MLLDGKCCLRLSQLPVKQTPSPDSNYTVEGVFQSERLRHVQATVEATVREFVRCFYGSTPQQCSATMFSSLFGMTKEKQSVLEVATGCVRSHLVEFSVFSDSVVSEIAGMAPLFPEQALGTSDHMVPTIAIGMYGHSYIFQII